jgi:hypothetical protein
MRTIFYCDGANAGRQYADYTVLSTRDWFAYIYGLHKYIRLLVCVSTPIDPDHKAAGRCESFAPARLNSGKTRPFCATETTAAWNDLKIWYWPYRWWQGNRI